MSARIAAARPPVRSMEATVSAAWAALSRLIDDNGSAGGGERLGDGAADAAGGAGDDGDFVGEGVGEGWHNFWTVVAEIRGVAKVRRRV